MTKHAQTRSQQRGISPMMVDLLMQFGVKEPAGSGATKVFLNKEGKRKLTAYAGRLASHLQQHLDIYAVLSADDEVITVAHRIEHIQRH
jgi:hypothetical protein